MALLTIEEAKLFLQIPAENTTKDALIEALIPEIEAQIREYCNQDFLDSEGAEYWPAGLKLPASMMIGYTMALMSGGGTSIGMQSESQGEYSYTRAQASGRSLEYPDNIMSMLNRFRIARLHYGSITQKPMDRRGMSIPQLAAGFYINGVDGDKYEDNA